MNSSATFGLSSQLIGNCHHVMQPHCAWHKSPGKSTKKHEGIFSESGDFPAMDYSGDQGRTSPPCLVFGLCPGSSPVGLFLDCPIGQRVRNSTCLIRTDLTYKHSKIVRRKNKKKIFRSRNPAISLFKFLYHIFCFPKLVIS